jgi:hypothetical protein
MYIVGNLLTAMHQWSMEAIVKSRVLVQSADNGISCVRAQRVSETHKQSGGAKTNTLKCAVRGTKYNERVLKNVPTPALFASLFAFSTKYEWQAKTRQL